MYFANMYPHNINAADFNDAGQLVALINSAYRGETAKKGWTYESDLISGSIRIDAKGMIELMEDPQAIFLKYNSPEHNIIGCVYLQIQDDKLYLGMLTVSPELQGIGIGKKLLDAAEVHAHKVKANSIIMRVITLRKELLEWYERHGYKDSGKTEPFPENSRFGKPLQKLVFKILEKKLYPPAK
ncbi:MAG: GNAT family N-acetyltransferase [Chitinophagaceae bacterium]